MTATATANEATPVTDEYVTISTELENFTQIIFGIRDLTHGIGEAALGRSKEGVVKSHAFLTREQNSEVFVDENYDALSGAFRLIAAATGILSDGIINDDLRIAAVPKREVQA